MEKSLLGKVMARPDLVRQVFDFARTAGVRAAYQRVQSRLDSLAPLGYSCVRANVLPDAARYNRDNVVATLAFRDGSIANVLYLANSDRSVPKEQFEVFCAGKAGRIDDFCKLDPADEGKTRRTRARRDKRHAREIELILEAIRRGSCSPIPFEELVEVFEVTIAIEEAIGTGKSVSLPFAHAPAV